MLGVPEIWPSMEDHWSDGRHPQHVPGSNFIARMIAAILLSLLSLLVLFLVCTFLKTTITQHGMQCAAHVLTGMTVA